MRKIEVSVKTDLGVNPHNYLDYQLDYKPYLDYMWEVFHGYMSQHHFIQIFMNKLSIKEHKAKYILKKMVTDKWIESISISSKHKFLYMKRKAVICVTGNEGNTDNKQPSNRQILRSLLLAEEIIKMNLYDTFIKQSHQDVFRYYSSNDSFVCLVTDIPKRRLEDYQKLIQELANFTGEAGFKVRIRFLTYSPERVSRLLKMLRNAEPIENIKILNPQLILAYRAMDLLPFFDNKEPLI